MKSVRRFQQDSGSKFQKVCWRSGEDNCFRSVSHGEEQPLDSDESELAMARNRRVDFRLMKGDIQLVLEDTAPVNDKGNPVSDKQ